MTTTRTRRRNPPSAIKIRNFNAIKRRITINFTTTANHRTAFPTTHYGRIVSMTGGQLVTKSLMSGECRHSIAADVKISRNGKPCGIEVLKPGINVRITLGKDRLLAVAVVCLGGE